MTRTTIMLPLDVKRRAITEARRLNVSFAEFVRQAISEKLPGQAKAGEGLRRRRQDPLFRLLDRLSTVKHPSISDASSDHDKYLYGSESEFRGK
jgi:hypothetical protein